MLTSFFLHISLFSFFFNMLFLFISGSLLEERWGEYFVTLIYLAGGIFGSIIHWIFTPISDLPIIGGGAAIAALMGVFAVVSFREKVRFFFWFSSGFVTICWLIQLVFQPIFEPLEAVTGQGISVPLITAVLGAIVGLERTGRFTKKVREERSKHYRKVHHGYELFGLARYDEARKIFEKVIDMDPENLEAYEGLARIYTHKNQEKESIWAYNRVIEIAIRKSRNPLKNYDTFKKLYPKGILEPENHYHLGNILEENGRFDEAIEVWREFCLGHPKNELIPKVLFNIGKIYLRLGRGEEAVGSFEEILKGYPGVDWIDLVKEEIEKARILIGH
jgi:tetratricopeptide (TPR) repeat protein